MAFNSNPANVPSAESGGGGGGGGAGTISGGLGIFPTIPMNKIRKMTKRATESLRGPIGDGDSLHLPTTENAAVLWYDEAGAITFNLLPYDFALTVTGWTTPPADVFWCNFWLDKADGSGGTTALLYILMGSSTEDEYYLVTLDSLDSRTYINTMVSSRPVGGTQGFPSCHLQRVDGDGLGSFTFTSGQHLLEFDTSGVIIYEAPSNISQLDGGWKINDTTYIAMSKTPTNQSASAVTHIQANITLQYNYQIDSSDPLHAWERYTMQAPAAMMGLPTVTTASTLFYPMGWDGSLEFWTTTGRAYSYDPVVFTEGMNAIATTMNMNAVPAYT